MMKRYLFLTLCLITLVLPVAVGAQGGETAADLVVLQTVPTTVDGQTRLRTYFVLRDRNGQPIIRDDLREGAFTLDGVATPTTVGKATDPIKIALVIDASGSMNDATGGTPLIDEVRAAAQRMIDIAPPNTEIVVFTFAEWVERQHPGLLRTRDQADLIKDVIGSFRINPSGQGDTCLYDAANKAIDALVAAEPTPTERLSVILFTDGKDRQAGGAACTSLGAPQVIRKALGSAGAPIPIYTIGVCVPQPGNEDPCGNVNRDELTALAEKTRAFPVIGPRNELDGLFTRLMAGLSSQWVAETTVCADAGSQAALLSVELDDEQLSEDVPFRAAETCLPPTSVTVNSQIYAPETDSYTVTLDLVSPERIGRMTIGVYAYAEGGAQVTSPLAFEQPTEQLVFTLPSGGMVSGSEYYLRITAVDDSGRPIQNAQGSPILANSKFAYQSRLSFTILGVEPNWADEVLVVTVKTSGVGDRPVQFRGLLQIPKTGGSDSLLPVMHQDGKLIFPMPRILRTATEVHDYDLVLEADNNGVPLRQSYQRQIAPRPEGGGRGLMPWLLAGLGAVVLSGVVAATVLLRRPQPAVKIVAPPPGSTVLYPAASAGLAAPAAVPPGDATAIAGFDATMLTRQLRLRVTMTPAPGVPLERTIAGFPYLIGRNAGTLTLPHDTKISGQHVKIEEVAGGFRLTDLNSRNGTWVGERRLGTGESVTFHEPIVVRLGPDTTIEFQPE